MTSPHSRCMHRGQHSKLSATHILYVRLPPSLPPSPVPPPPPSPSQKSTLHELQAVCPHGTSWDHFLSKLTRHWYSWPFYHQPFWIQTRVMDMYVTEGPKVLYRLGLAAVKLFVAHGKHIGEWLSIHGEDTVSSIPLSLSRTCRTKYFGIHFFHDC